MEIKVCFNAKFLYLSWNTFAAHLCSAILIQGHSLRSNFIWGTTSICFLTQRRIPRTQLMTQFISVPFSLTKKGISQRNLIQWYWLRQQWNQSRQVSLSGPPTHSSAIRYQSLHIRPPPSSQLSIFPANSSIWDKLGYYEVHFLIRRIRLLWGQRGPSVQGWKSVAEAGAGYRCCFFHFHFLQSSSLSLSTELFSFEQWNIQAIS